MTDSPEVVIVGAGPAGSALAYWLAHRGLEVLLLDKAAFPRDKTCGDAMTPRALQAARSLGVLDDLLPLGRRANRVRLLAPDGQPLVTEVPPFRDWPAYLLVVPRLRLDDALRRHALAAGVAFRQLAVTSLLMEGGQVVGVRGAGPNGDEELRAPLVVLATGAAYGLLDRAGLLDHTPVSGRAARAYYEGVQGLDDAVEFHFERSLLPGYGWVFPISPTAANVGAGYYCHPNRPPPRNSPAAAVADFIRTPDVAPRLAGAQRLSPVKGYPFRTDFHETRTAYPGLLLVGEAAGLVNPLTGEGIDYALESAEVCADVITRWRAAGQPLGHSPADYSQALRARFLQAFVETIRVRDVYIRAWVLNKAVRAAVRHPAFRLKMFHAVIGNTSPRQALSLGSLLQVAMA